MREIREVTIASRAFKLVTAAALGTVVCVFVALGSRARAYQPRISPARREFFGELGPLRSIRARIVGAPYASYKVLSGISDRVPGISSKVREIAERGSPEALSDWGTADVFAGRYDQAITRLEQSAALAPKDARIRSDLAAAYLARTPRTGFRDAVQALAQALRAVNLDSTLPEARFNHALALEELSLSNDATASWREYLRLDAASPWAREARSHLATLASELEIVRHPPDFLKLVADGDPAAARRAVARDPQEARRFVEEELLPRWERLEAEGKESDAAAILGSMRELAEILSEVERDSLLVESIDAVARAVGTSNSASRLKDLIAGHRQYDAGRSVLQAGDAGKAKDLFLASRAALMRASSPFALWADFQLGLCAYQENDYLVERAWLEPIAAESSRYPTLSMRALWVLGLGQGVQGDLESALPLFREALLLARHSGEQANAGAIEGLIAENLRYLGKGDEASIHLYTGVRSVTGMREIRRRVAVFSESANVATTSGLPEVALLFRETTIRDLAAGLDRPALVFALLNRADTKVALGRIRGALEDLQEARRLISQLADDGIRELFLGNHLSRLGTILRRVDPRQAVRSLSESIVTYHDARYSLLLPDLLKERALAYESLGRVDLVERDLLAAIELVERGISQIKDNAVRSGFLDRFGDLFDEMILFEISQGRTEEGFKYEERARAADLPFAMTLDPAEIVRDLPQGLTVIGYSAIRDHLFIWTVGRGRRVSVVRSPLSPRAADALVSSLRAAITGGTADGEFERASAELYKALIRPVEAEFVLSRFLEILPCKVLSGIPFAALKDAASGRYLVEKLAIGIAPSASSFVESITHGRAQSLSRRSALIVGDPAFRVDLFRGLQRLPEAAREAKKIAAFYRRPKLLVGRDATKKSFLGAVGAYPVVHFAGHNAAYKASLLHSGLVFAAGGADEGILTADEICRTKLSATLVVVLSACGTAIGDTSAADGSASLARPFLVAGASAVVASLWSVVDRDALDLITAFHSRLSAGGDPVTALHLAQLEMLDRCGRHVSAVRKWGAFEVFEGSPKRGGP